MYGYVHALQAETVAVCFLQAALLEREHQLLRQKVRCLLVMLYGSVF